MLRGRNRQLTLAKNVSPGGGGVRNRKQSARAEVDPGERTVGTENPARRMDYISFGEESQESAQRSDKRRISSYLGADLPEFL